ncbi:MAG: XRE family transcriptional regulator [Kiritimatiellales bacterium]|jgi:Zn-dependent peptidase ImmA (M78 family)/DNA-binding XRE family transcriptional regulator
MKKERLKQARLACGLSLDQVADALVKKGRDVTKASLSNYEKGKRAPNALILREMAEVYRVSGSYFFELPIAEVEWFSFRAKTTLGLRKREAVQAFSAKQAERYMRVCDLLPQVFKADFPERRTVCDFAEADSCSADLRKRWKLGKDPVDSVTQCLENHGALIVQYNEKPTTDFDGLSARVNKRHPLLIVNSTVPVDRLRFDLLHELGHVLMDTSSVPDDEETLAHRFASSFLVPPEKVKQELGETRRNLTLSELVLLKEKYGLSVAAWLYSAGANGIITQTLKDSLWRQLSARGWRMAEPDVFKGNEEPTKLRQSALRAVSEGLISARETVRLFPELKEQLKEEGLLVESKAELLRKLPAAERKKALQVSAEKMAAFYKNDQELTAFETFGEGDLHEQ